MFARAVDSNQKPYSLARITMSPKEIVLVEVELSSYTVKVLTGGRTDRQTGRQTRCIKGDHSQKVMQRVLAQSQQKKNMRCRLHVKKYGRIDLKHLLQFPDQPSPVLGSTEDTAFVYLPKKSKYLKADFL